MSAGLFGGESAPADGSVNQKVDLSVQIAQRTPMTAQLDAIFFALADPTRRAMLAMLVEDDMAVSDLAAPFDMSLAAISKHIGVLAAAGLIEQTRQGRVKWCQLAPEALRPATLWLEGFGQYGVAEADDLDELLAWFRAASAQEEPPQ